MITTIITYILMSFGLGICINAILYDKLDMLTRHKKDTSIVVNGNYVYVFILFGVFCLLFLKKIRENRKRLYYIGEVSSYEYWYHKCEYGKMNNEQLSEYNKMKRYLKLKNLNK